MHARRGSAARAPRAYRTGTSGRACRAAAGPTAGPATIRALPLDAPGRVPWWPPDRADTTLSTLLVHVVAETARHAGHADVVRELVDGRVGPRPEHDNMAPGDEADWEAYRTRLEQVAREVSGG